jgi:hypothetical protein
MRLWSRNTARLWYLISFKLRVHDTVRVQSLFNMNLMQEFSMTSGDSEGTVMKTILGYLEEDIVQCGEFHRVQENAFEFYETME